MSEYYEHGVILHADGSITHYESEKEMKEAMPSLHSPAIRRWIVHSVGKFHYEGMLMKQVLSEKENIDSKARDAGLSFEEYAQQEI